MRAANHIVIGDGFGFADGGNGRVAVVEMPEDGFANAGSIEFADALLEFGILDGFFGVQNLKDKITKIKKVKTITHRHFAVLDKYKQKNNKNKLTCVAK